MEKSALDRKDRGRKKLVPQRLLRGCYWLAQFMGLGNGLVAPCHRCRFGQHGELVHGEQLGIGQRQGIDQALRQSPACLSLG